ncbi:PaaX family transcriptional regulator [Arthrobacter bambusae]|uniref:PaaX family transcriptional regulator n=1 Tax=Arthrobacter bambusae TaxID=1338426 RepID=UPI0027832001|nr:PaaX family transcriptional regulator C-terminal domain-containing protein [Arthrobacter bambusae]MDQ0030402.1 phenylacetic acid degradation operon negative regulatory protein [Arthrobacter bambusae]MDQ0098319.1 phenylacetic acid degradation operon negative regulatory protein [Arthrobacter bambusae]
MSAVLDDMDSRPGSTTSLLRTVIGLYLRDAGGWMSTRHIIALMEALGLTAAASRTALSRLKKKDIVLPQLRHGVPGFAVTEGAAAMLARGDRRIFTPRLMSSEDRWCLVSFSIPETEREKRHQLRRRLHWIGCGTVAAGLWICPDSLREEVEEILEDLGLRAMATVFVADTPLVGGNLRDAASGWWDLEAVAELHRDFIRHHGSAADDGGPVEGSDGGPPTAGTFARYVRCIDRWRIIPYLDPGLPAGFLPEDWPGTAGIALFERIRSEYASPSAEFVRRTLEG